MSKYWHYFASSAVAVAVLCLFLIWLTGDQGRHTFELFDSQFGIARSKAEKFVVWRGKLFEFPLDRTLFSLAYVGIGVAIAITWYHFRTGRKN